MVRALNALPSKHHLFIGGLSTKKEGAWWLLVKLVGYFRGPMSTWRHRGRRPVRRRGPRPQEKRLIWKWYHHPKPSQENNKGKDNYEEPEWTQQLLITGVPPPSDGNSPVSTRYPIPSDLPVPFAFGPGGKMEEKRRIDFMELLGAPCVKVCDSLLVSFSCFSPQDWFFFYCFLVFSAVIY